MLRRGVDVLEIFEESETKHLSADEVYKKLFEAGDEVGLATVYRVLTQFESAGILMKQNFENGHSVYELTPNDHHDHMVCLKTGKVIEFTNEIIEEQQEKLAEERGQAEIQNLRRISQNEVTKARLYGNENLVKDLIPSIDNLFRTLEHQDIEAKTVPAEGISLIVREIISALEKNGISVIDPKGEEFDPKEHEALSVSDDDKEKPNIVLEVFQKGFKFNERVVRPAMVVVNKK